MHKLRGVLERLSCGEIVQNRQLKTLLGVEHYARYLDDCECHQYLRTTLKDKPKEITEYEKRLRDATFSYSKADNKSQKGRSRTAKKIFGAFDRLFERLSEYLTEKIAGHHDLEIWFDRPLATGAEDSFGLDPDSFPKIITSKSPKNMGGGYLGSKRTIREVKVDAVQRALEQLTAPEADDSVEINEQMARFAALIKRAGD